MAGAGRPREEVEARLARSPYHRWLGLKIGEIGDGTIEIVMPWRDEILSRTEPHPVVHGGILGSLIDMAGLFVVFASGSTPTGTAYMHVDYHRPATAGPLTAKGRILKLGRTLSTAEIFIYGPDGKLLASGRGGYPCEP